MQKEWGKLVAPPEKPRLLVVDDEPDMLDFIERTLRKQFSITRTHDPAYALELLASGRYAVFITDEQMPRISGSKLLKRISERYPSIVRILISGYTEVPDIQKAVEQGTIHKYILKPVDSQKLLDAVEKAFEASGHRLVEQDG
jgi:DNA-binding NtrC family response regulator